MKGIGYCKIKFSLRQSTIGGTSQCEVPERIEFKNNSTNERTDQTAEDISIQVKAYKKFIVPKCGINGLVIM